jgi:phosphatidate cytidylyltransferase
MALGKRKLIPHVSPGKTVAGAVGSLLLSCLVAVLLRRPLLDAAVRVDVAVALLLGVLINVTSQLGDLVESLLKRRCHVKDSGRVLPEHGGVLDLIDSFLFSVPAFFFVLVRLT